MYSTVLYICSICSMFVAMPILLLSLVFLSLYISLSISVVVHIHGILWYNII